jgi:Fe-S oxidoreductase
MYSPAALEAFAAVKRVFDPDGVLNPGIVVDPAAVDTDLRAPAARTLRSGLGLAHRADAGDLSAAAHRCTGVGRCRDAAVPAPVAGSASGPVMCPSYRATGDEKDSTRARARVLQELARGTLPGGWRSPALRESLDLCLSCKGCLADCPTGVDIAAFRAEWLYQRYRHRPRPPAHYVLGDLPRWVRLAARVPRLANLLLGAPVPAAAGKRLAGIDPGRDLPRLAPATFRQQFEHEPPPRGHGLHRHRATGHDHGQGPGHGPEREGTGPVPASRRPVLLFVDCFTDHFAPQVGVAATRLLRDAGFMVSLSPPGLCCGLTWLSTGRLDTARRTLRRTAQSLAATGDTPILGLEPSCTAVLRRDAEEVLAGTPSSVAATSVAARVRTLAELLSDHPGWQAPNLSGTTVVAQPHCHHHAVTGWQADRDLLAVTGAEVETVGGCCGMAGNFGAERGHYVVSVAVAETALLPAVRRHPNAVVLADGFSCRTQLDQLAGRASVHLAELLLAAGPNPPGTSHDRNGSRDHR